MRAACADFPVPPRATTELDRTFGAAFYRSAFSLSASRSHRHFSSTHSPPPLPHPAAQFRVAEEHDDALRGLLGRAAADDPAGLAVQDRVGGAARVARDDGQAGRGGLQVDDAEPLDVEPAPAGPARHREDVPGAVVRGQLGPGHRAREAHGVGDLGLPGQLAQLLLVRTAADDQQHRVRLGGQDARHREDEGVLPLARHQPGHAHDHRPVAQPEPRPDGVTARLGVEGLLVDPRRQLHHPPGRLRRQGGGDPRTRVLPEVGDRVRRLPDPAQQSARGGQLRPPRLVTVGRGHQPLGARLPQRRRHQPERRRRPEPHRRTPVFAQQPDGPPGRARRGQQHRRTVAYDGEGLLGVEGGGRLDTLPAPLPGGGVDDEALGVQAQRHVVQKRLDTARPGREVVRHDQGLVHRGRPYPTGAHSSARPRLWQAHS